MPNSLTLFLKLWLCLYKNPCHYLPEKAVGSWLPNPQREIFLRARELLYLVWGTYPHTSSIHCTDSLWTAHYVHTVQQNNVYVLKCNKIYGKNIKTHIPTKGLRKCKWKILLENKSKKVLRFYMGIFLENDFKSQMFKFGIRNIKRCT